VRNICDFVLEVDSTVDFMIKLGSWEDLLRKKAWVKRRTKEECYNIEDLQYRFSFEISFLSQKCSNRGLPPAMAIKCLDCLDLVWRELRIWVSNQHENTVCVMQSFGISPIWNTLGTIKSQKTNCKFHMLVLDTHGYSAQFSLRFWNLSELRSHVRDRWKI